MIYKTGTICYLHFAISRECCVNLGLSIHLSIHQSVCLFNLCVMLLQNPIYFGSHKVKGYCHKVTLLIKYEGRSQKFLYCLVHGFHEIPLAVLQLFQHASRYGYNVSLSQQKVTYKVLLSLFMQMQQVLSGSIVHAGGFIHQSIHVLGIVRIFKAVVTDSRYSHSAYQCSFSNVVLLSLSVLLLLTASCLSTSLAYIHPCTSYSCR